MKKILTILIFSSILVSCQLTPKNDIAPLKIQCEVYYQSSTNVEEQTQKSTSIFELSAENSNHVETYSDMSVKAKFSDDDFEGRTLSITISDPTTGLQLASHLYQFQKETLPSNEFVGGHGFTGLSYVYHPLALSEIQYFCFIN
jgi:hypothetical protein